MHYLMCFKIKNPKLAFLALIVFAILVSLGTWQLHRAQEKTALLAAFAKHTQYPPLTAAALLKPHDWQFYRATLTGEFLNDKTVLLDNKLFHGRIGYEVFTPFRFKPHSTILVDRGFLAQPPQGRMALPWVKPLLGTQTVTGFLKRPAGYVSLGAMVDQTATPRPFRIEFINLFELKTLLNEPNLNPYLLILDPNHPDAYPLEWQIVTLGPERHIGYAVQWFALALTLLVIFVALNRGRST